MVVSIIWLPVAQKHLKHIFVFIRKKSEQAAIKILNEIIDATEALIHFPQLGCIELSLEDCSKTYRFLVVRNYKIIYYTERNVVYIAAVWDCRQNTSRLKQLFNH